MKNFFKYSIIVIFVSIIFCAVLDGLSNDKIVSSEKQSEINEFEEYVDNGKIVSDGIMIEQNENSTPYNFFSFIGSKVTTLVITVVNGIIHIIVEIVSKFA